ncbi:cation transporter [Mesorhizobium onobrychidis]|uniref:Cation transporter n=1 Tax=Mesorhizobium onobrychidis TaxID=2775404 RepID=A0ABY5QV23_9HYPH|nr:cation transporter [Mesorhizobium onobrychidis]UVC13932.1 cation transporter [Mesorhizobium onobrychidis]
MQPLRKTNDRSNGEATAARTARLAVLAGAPGLLLTAYAAASSTSLTIRADLALTLMDMLVLVTVAIVAGGRKNAGTGRKRQAVLAETLANALAALGMCLSMAIVASIAVQRIAAGGVEPRGQGVFLAMNLNLAYAVVNFWILRQWKARNRLAASALARAQICLFSDKLSSNLLIAASLATAMIWQGTMIARFIDPVAGLLIATMTARWTIPVVRDTVRSLRREFRRARKPVA